MSSHIVSVRSDDPCIDRTKILLSDTAPLFPGPDGDYRIPMVSPKTIDGMKTYVVSGMFYISEKEYEVEQKGLSLTVTRKKEK